MSDLQIIQTLDNDISSSDHMTMLVRLQTWRGSSPKYSLFTELNYKTLQIIPFGWIISARGLKVEKLVTWDWLLDISQLVWIIWLTDQPSLVSHPAIFDIIYMMVILTARLSSGFVGNLFRFSINYQHDQPSPDKPRNNSLGDTSGEGQVWGLTTVSCLPSLTWLLFMLVKGSGSVSLTGTSLIIVAAVRGWSRN